MPKRGLENAYLPEDQTYITSFLRDDERPIKAQKTLPRRKFAGASDDAKLNDKAYENLIFDEYHQKEVASREHKNRAKASNVSPDDIAKISDEFEQMRSQVCRVIMRSQSENNSTWENLLGDLIDKFKKENNKLPDELRRSTNKNRKSQSPTAFDISTNKSVDIKSNLTKVNSNNLIKAVNTAVVLTERMNSIKDSLTGTMDSSTMKDLVKRLPLARNELLATLEKIQSDKREVKSNLKLKIRARTERGR